MAHGDFRLLPGLPFGPAFSQVPGDRRVEIEQAAPLGDPGEKGDDALLDRGDVLPGAAVLVTTRLMLPYRSSASFGARATSK